MPASMKKVKKPMLHVTRLDGEIFEEYNYTQPHITFLPDNKYLCTCGEVYIDINGFHSHKKSLIHLIRTKQIHEYHPTLSPAKQKEMLIDSKTKIW